MSPVLFCSVCSTPPLRSAFPPPSRRQGEREDARRVCAGGRRHARQCRPRRRNANVPARCACHATPFLCLSFSSSLSHIHASQGSRHYLTEIIHYCPISMNNEGRSRSREREREERRIEEAERRDAPLPPLSLRCGKVVVVGRKC